MMTGLQKLAAERTFARGTSKAAVRRSAERGRGTLYRGKPGDVIEMDRERVYRVAPDGSFRGTLAAVTSSPSKASRARKAPRCRAPWMRHDWLEDVCARCGAARNVTTKAAA
jgi:hypothetical protein